MLMTKDGVIHEVPTHCVLNFQHEGWAEVKKEVKEKKTQSKKRGGNSGI